MKRVFDIVKGIFAVIYMLLGAAWILLTSKSERRQLDYDLGYGEIE